MGVTPIVGPLRAPSYSHVGQGLPCPTEIAADHRISYVGNGQMASSLA